MARIELNEETFKQSLLRVVDLAKNAISELNVESHDDSMKVCKVLKNLNLLETELKDDITYFRNVTLYAQTASNYLLAVNVHPLETLKLQTAVIIVDVLRTACKSRVECM